MAAGIPELVFGAGEVLVVVLRVQLFELLAGLRPLPDLERHAYGFVELRAIAR